MTEITQTTVSGNNVYIIDDAGNTLVIDSTRNRVGIGTNNPGYELAVDGTIHSTGLVQGVNLTISSGGGGVLTFADGTTQATANTGDGTVTSVSTTLSGISIANASTTPAISGTLGVANGGTGATTLTDGGILLGSATGVVTVTSQPTNGQLLIGSSGNDPVLATLTDGTGITITEGAGTITVASSITQSIGANPTATVSGSATDGSATTFMRSDGAPALAATAVTPATYGSATEVAQIAVDQQGRITSAANLGISFPAETFTLTADSGSNQTIGDGNTMDIAGGTGLSTVVGATDTVTVNLDNTAVTPASYTYSAITVDAQGRLTAASSGAAPGTMSSWILSDGSATQTVSNGNTVTVTGGTGLTSTVSATDTVTLDLDDTAVTAASYGDATNVAQFTVDAQGRLTAAAAVGITYPAKAQFTLTADSGSDQTISDGNTMDIAGGTGLSSVVGATDTVTLNLDNTAVTAGSYTYSAITVDAQGRLTAAASGAAPAIDGSGAATQVTFWTDADTVAGNAGFTFDTTDDTVAITADSGSSAGLTILNTGAGAPQITIGDSFINDAGSIMDIIGNTNVRIRPGTTPTSGNDKTVSIELKDAAGAVKEYITALTTTGQKELSINNDGADIDFRVESVAQANAFKIDAAGETASFAVPVTLGASINSYAGSAPTNGQLLIGDTATGLFDAATLTAGSNVTITNAAGAITIAASGGGGSTSPGGANTQVQFNNSGSFGGSANFTFDGTNLGVSNNITGGAKVGGNTLDTSTVTAGQYALTTTANHVWAGAPVGSSPTVMPAVDLAAGNYTFADLGGAGNCSQTHYLVVVQGDPGGGNGILMPDPAAAGLPAGSRWTISFNDPSGQPQIVAFPAVPLNGALSTITATAIAAVTVFTDGVGWFLESDAIVASGRLVYA